MTHSGWEVRLYSRTNTGPVGPWTLVDILSEYKGFNFTKVVNDAGSGSITMDYRALSAAVKLALTKQCLVAFAKPEKRLEGIWSSLGTDVAFGFLPENLEHSYGSPQEYNITLSGPGVAEALNRSIVLPATYPNTSSPAQRPFTAVRPLDCWVDLRAEAAVREASGAWITPWVTFGGDLKAVDSNNVAWPANSAMNIEFELRSGSGLLEVLKWAQEFGDFDFSVQFNGYQDQLLTHVFCFQDQRQDLTNKIAFFLGRHHLSGKRTHTRESIMSHLYSTVTEAGIGDRINHFSGSAWFNYGMREFFWAQAEQFQHSHANQLGLKILNSKIFEITNLTFEVVPNLDHRAFIDYDIHDKVTYDNHLLELRVPTIIKGIAVSVRSDPAEEVHEVMIETPVETLARRLYNAQNRLEQQFKYNSKLTQV